MDTAGAGRGVVAVSVAALAAVGFAGAMRRVQRSAATTSTVELAEALHPGVASPAVFLVASESAARA